MKKILFAALAVVAVVSFAGCGEDVDGNIDPDVSIEE